MKILTFIEHIEGIIQKPSLAALTAAAEIAKINNGEVTALIIGKDALLTANQLSKSFACITTEDEFLCSYIASNYEEAVIAAAEKVNAEYYVFPATSIGKDLAPRIAARLNAGQASDIIAVNADNSFKRLMYAGDIIADVVIETEKKVVTVRPTAFQPYELLKDGAVKEIEKITVSKSSINAEFISKTISESARPKLGDASIVVSGGRALGSAENFEKVLFPLADTLKAAVGASRAAVDSGFAPNDWQVGQTGKVVAPSLYLAVGISGAIQHIAGMKDSKTIVAINKDPEAPIFEVADYGLVGDLFTIVPELVEKLKN